MNTTDWSNLRRLLLAPTCATLTVSLALAQAQPAAATDAATLARYDVNRNGVLDASELATKAADDARAANTPVTTTQAPGASTPPRDVVELAPFEVSASDDGSYSASNTMAGTRMNSRLEDIAGSISIVTKQQLMDTAAVDINDIFLFEVGTEGTGQFTDLTNDGRGDYDNIQGNPTGSNRMRGLSAANIAVGGFAANSSVPLDTYNLDAVEISRGANSTLSGPGEAGGTVNIVQSRANLNREITTFSGRVDSYGGTRATMDISRPLIPGKLALRFSGAYTDTAYIRKPSYERTDRQYLALTFKPFARTTLNATIEWVNQSAVRANSSNPIDTISLWESRGSPTYDPATRTYTVNGVRSGPITNTNQLPLGIGGIGSANARVLMYIDDGAVQKLIPGAAPTNTLAGTNNLQQLIVSSNVPNAGGLFKTPASTDKSFYDWTKINLGASGYEEQRSISTNVSLDQSLLSTQRNRMDLQLAWRREDQDRYQRQHIGQLDGVGATVVLDVNESFNDGTPNPFFLRPFIGGVNPQAFRRPVFTDSYRWQLGWQFDMRREQNLLKHIGLHRLTAYQEHNKTMSSPNGLRYVDLIVDNPRFNPGLLNDPIGNVTGAAGARFYEMYYMGDTQGGGIEYANTGAANIWGQHTARFIGNTASGDTAWRDETVNVQEVYFSQGTQKRKLNTGGFSLQSFFWNDNIVTTYGRRKDRNYTIQSLGLPVVGGFPDVERVFDFGQDKRWREGETETRGIVVKPFRTSEFLNREFTGAARYAAQAIRGFNMHYSESNTFRPVDSAYSLYLEELPNPTGESKEWGFSLNMFDNKFNMRLTRQETIQKDTRAGTGVLATRALSIDFDIPGQTRNFDLMDTAVNWYLQLDPTLTLEDATVRAAGIMGYSREFLDAATGKSISDISDALSKGWELELQFNPSRYWTLRATGNQQEAIDSGVSINMQKFIDERLPIWTSIRIPTDTIPGGGQLEGAGELWWTGAGPGDTPENYFINNVQNPLNLAIANDGKKKTQTREYSLNIITSYRLAGISQNRFLRNMSVGGTYRWASAATVGYYGMPPDPDGIVRSLDRDRPFEGPSTSSIDLLLTYNTRMFRDRVNATFQLNVRNATESGRLQGIAINPDGQYWRYRIVDPRQFILTATFSL